MCAMQSKVLNQMSLFVRLNKHDFSSHGRDDCCPFGMVLEDSVKGIRGGGGKQDK